MWPFALFGLGLGVLWWLNKSNPGSDNALGYPSWTPPDAPGPADAAVVAIDPRVTPSHATGAGIACIPNPPPPEGWAYAGASAVTAGVPPVCVAIINDPTTYPMGSFVQQYVDGNLIAVRVEWHNLLGASNTSGCFRGSNIFSPTDAPYPGMA